MISKKDSLAAYKDCCASLKEVEDYSDIGTKARIVGLFEESFK